MKTQIVVKNEEIEHNKFINVNGNMGNNKPREGGFWTSTLKENGKSEWIEFAEDNGFYAYDKFNTLYIEVSDGSRVLKIDSRDDYLEILDKCGLNVDIRLNELAVISGSDTILDLEMLSNDYDGLSLTKKGLIENNKEFYGWDCESTLWFNIDKFTEIT